MFPSTPHQSTQNGNYMMESLKSNMMTMMMLQNVNGGGGSGRGGSGGGSGGSNMFTMVYMFLATNLVDFIFKYLPILFVFLQKKYSDKLTNIQQKLSNSTTDITDNKVKKKTASITITVNVNNPSNILGQSILDYITNHKNTTHVSYIRESFILNQKDVITIDEEIFAKMTVSTGEDEFSTNQSQTTTNGNTNTNIIQIIELYSFTKTTDQLREYLDNIKQKYMINVKNKLGNKRYFFNIHPITAPILMENIKDYSRLPPNMIFTMKQFQTNRKFSNLFGEYIDLIRSRVQFFCKNRRWYDEKGIPYTLGLLLSGNPGTGKTSTIKCLANETNRHICNVNLNNDISKRQLENLFFNEDITVMNQNTGQTETYCIPLDQRIYVLEDVDCQADIVKERAKETVPEEPANKNAKNSKNTVEETQKINADKQRIDLSFLLNLLDGVLENPGRIVIMTSNFPDVLDSALVRPGRIDIIAKFKNCTFQTIVKMLEFFYDFQLSPSETDELEKLQPEMITPAELSKIMFENFSDYKKTIEHLIQLSDVSIPASSLNTDTDTSTNLIDFRENEHMGSPEPEQPELLEIDSKPEPELLEAVIEQDDDPALKLKKLVEGANVKFYCTNQKIHCLGKIFSIIKPQLVGKYPQYSLIDTDNKHRSADFVNIQYIDGPTKKQVVKRVDATDPELTSWFTEDQTMEDGEFVSQDLLNDKMQEYKDFLKSILDLNLKSRFNQHVFSDIFSDIEKGFYIEIYTKIFNNTEFFRSLVIHLFQREQLGLFDTTIKDLSYENAFSFKRFKIHGEAVYFNSLQEKCFTTIIKKYVNKNDFPAYESATTSFGSYSSYN